MAALGAGAEREEVEVACPSPVFLVAERRDSVKLVGTVDEATWDCVTAVELWLVATVE